MAMKTGYELLVSLDWQTIIIQLINLGIQILLFKKFLYKPVMKILRKRQGLVDQPLKEAEAAKQAALTRFFCMAEMTFAWLYSAILSMAAKRP